MAEQKSGAENGEMPHRSEGPLLHAEQHEDGNRFEHSPSATTITHALTTTSYLSTAGNSFEEPIQGVSVKQEGIQQQENENQDYVDGNLWSDHAKQPATVTAADTKSKTDSIAGDKHPSISNLSKSGIKKRGRPTGSLSHFGRAYGPSELSKRRLQRGLHRLQQSKPLNDLRSEHAPKDDDEAPRKMHMPVPSRPMPDELGLRFIDESDLFKQPELDMEPQRHQLERADTGLARKRESRDAFSPQNDMAVEESPWVPYQWPVPSESEEWERMDQIQMGGEMLACASPQFGRGIERYATTKISKAMEWGVIEPERPPQLNEKPDESQSGPSYSQEGLRSLSFSQTTEPTYKNPEGKSFLM